MPKPLCYEGQVRHYNPTNRSLPALNVNIVSGFLEVCYQGDWVSICLSDVSIIDTTHLSQLACKTIYGSDGKLIKKLFATDVGSTLNTQSHIVELKRALL